MLNQQTHQRELSYCVLVTDVQPIEGYDRVEEAVINGWHCVVGKGDFKPGDKAVYFEIDSLLPADKFADFKFLAKKKFKVKTQKMCKRISQGLLLTFEQCGLNADDYNEGDFLTEIIGVTYADPSDQKRKKSSGNNNTVRYNKFFTNALKKHAWLRKVVKNKYGRKICAFIFKPEVRDDKFPKHFPTIHVTDQERCENMPWVLQDKTPYIVTQKCDGTSATYILERKKHDKYEFYVCSRNVRQMNEDQECYHNTNVYWEMEHKYDIKNKLTHWLERHMNSPYICWQGEICGPDIQKNPQALSERHFFAFHMINENGKYDMREAKKIWDSYDIETVPIVDENYIMPDDFEEFKLQADGCYDPSVCEGKADCPREGYVYYKTTDPNFSFKNVSREYLLNH